MERKVRIEIDEDADEVIIIRAKKLTEDVLSLQKMLTGNTDGEKKLPLTIGEKEYFVSLGDILFFETEGGHTAAHTDNKMYYTTLKLYELDDILPKCFMRISKSCILNADKVSSIRRSATGVCEAFLSSGEKKVYVSRMYFKPFKEYLTERNLRK